MPQGSGAACCLHSFTCAVAHGESATAHWANIDFEKYVLLANSYMFWAAMSPNVLHRICQQSFYLTVELERANRMRHSRQSLSATVRSPLDVEWEWRDNTRFIFLGSIWWIDDDIMTGNADDDEFWLMLSFPHSERTTLYSWCIGCHRNEQSVVTQFIAENQHRVARIGGVMSIRSNSSSN